jgi:hypothetical protein
MAQYVPLPDGTYVTVRENETPQEAYARARQEYPEAFKRREPEAKPESGFFPAARAGFESLKGEAALTAGKLGLMGLKEAEEYRAEREKEAKRIFKPTEEGWTEAPFAKIKELLGGSLPYMAAPVAAGLGVAAAPLTGTAAVVTAGLAAGAASVAQFTGSNLARQIEEAEGRGEDASLERAKLGNAVAAAVPQAALDVISLRGIPLIRNLFKSVGKDITEKEAKALVEQGFKQKLADYGRTTLMTSGREGFTEAGQQYLERLQAGLEVTDPAARAEYLESFIGGAVLGGTLAPAGRFFERGREQGIAEAKLRDIDNARRKAEREEVEKQEALEAEKRKQPEYLTDLQARYEAAKKQDNDLKAEIKQLEARKDDPASLARAKELRKELKDFQQSELSGVVKEYNKAGGDKFFKDFAERQRIAGMTPEDYMLEQLTKEGEIARNKEYASLKAQLKQVDRTSDAARMIRQRMAELRPAAKAAPTEDLEAEMMGGLPPISPREAEAQDLNRYAADRLKLADDQLSGTGSGVELAEYLAQDPKKASRLVETNAQLPGMSRAQSNLLLTELSKQLSARDVAQREIEEADLQRAKILTESPQQNFVAQWEEDQAALDEERKESVFDTRLTQLVNTALKGVPTVEVPELSPEKRRVAGPQQLDLLAAGVEGERAAAGEQPAGMRRPAEVLTRLDDLIAQRDAAARTAGQAFSMGDRNTGAARSADREAAQTALNEIEQQGGAPATLLKLRKQQEAALMNSAGLLDDLRTGTLLGEKAKGAASSTADTIRVQIDKERAAFIDAAIKEAAVTRRMFGKALTQDEALKAALQMQQVFDEWVKRTAAAPTSAIEFIKSYERLPSVANQKWLDSALEAYKKQVINQALAKKIGDVSAQFESAEKRGGVADLKQVDELLAQKAEAVRAAEAAFSANNVGAGRAYSQRAEEITAELNKIAKQVGPITFILQLQNATDVAPDSNAKTLRNQFVKQLQESQSLAAQQATQNTQLTNQEIIQLETKATSDFYDAYEKYQPRRPAYEKRYNKDGSSTYVMVDKGRTRLVDPRSLEERRFGDYKRATEVLQEQLSQLSRNLSAVPEEGQRVESLLRPQYAQQEAGRVAEARGETAQTLEGELRRRRDYVSGLIDRALQSRTDLPEEIADALRRAQDAIESGRGGRDVLTEVSPEGKAGPAPFAAGLLDSAERLAERVLAGRTAEVEGGVKGYREQKGYDAVVFKRDQIKREFDAQQRVVDGGVTPAGKRFSEGQKRKAQAHLNDLETQLTNLNKQLSGAKRPTVEPVRVGQAAVTGEDAKLIEEINTALRLASPVEGAPAERMTDEQRAQLAQQGFAFEKAGEPVVTKYAAGKTEYDVLYDNQPAKLTIERDSAGVVVDAKVKVRGEKFAALNLGKQGILSDEQLLQNLYDAVDAIKPVPSSKAVTKQQDLFEEKELPATAFARATAKNFENSPPVKKARAAVERGKQLLADIKEAWGAKDKADDDKRKVKIAETEEAIDKQREVYRETFQAALKKAQMAEVEAQFQKEITAALQSLQAVSKERAAAEAAGDKDAVRLIDVIRDAERDALLQLQADLAKALEKPSQNVEPAQKTGLRSFQLPAELQAAADEWVQFERNRLTKLEEKLKRLQGSEKKEAAKEVVAQRTALDEAKKATAPFKSPGVETEQARIAALEKAIPKIKDKKQKQAAEQQLELLKQVAARRALAVPGVRVEGAKAIKLVSAEGKVTPGRRGARVTALVSAEEEATQRRRAEGERMRAAADESAARAAEKQAREDALVEELLDLGTEYGVKKGQLDRAKTDASKDRLKAELAEIENKATILEAQIGTAKLTRTQKAKLRKSRASLFTGKGVGGTDKEVVGSLQARLTDSVDTAVKRLRDSGVAVLEPGKELADKATPGVLTYDQVRQQILVTEFNAAERKLLLGKGQKAQTATQRAAVLQAGFEGMAQEKRGKGTPLSSLEEPLEAEDVMSSFNIEGKDVLFSKAKGTPNNPSTTATLTAELEKALGFGLRTDKVKIYDNLADLLAANPQFQGKIPADASAFVYAKRGDEPTAYLIASNIGKGAGLAILLHEVGAHIGFRNLFSESQYRGLASAVKSWAKRMPFTLEGKIGRAAVARAQAAKTTAEQMDDEIIAYAVEEAVKAGIKPDAVAKEGGVVRAWLKTVVDKLKQALQKFGVSFQDMKVGDLVNMAYGAAHLELRGTWHGTGALFQEFDHKYIGTGEGAQVYGWGTYRAQRYGTADNYRRQEQAKLDLQSNFFFDNFRYKGMSFDDMMTRAKKLTEDARIVASYFENGGMLFESYNKAAFEKSVQSFIDSQRRNANWRLNHSTLARDLNRAKKELDALDAMDVADFTLKAYSGDKGAPQARMLRVLGNRPESEYYMLDLPLKDQSQYVQNAVDRALNDLPFTEPLRVKQLKSLFQQSRLRGDDFIFQLNDIFKDVGLTPKDASMWLFEHGIAGHKYLDRAARTGKVTDIDARFNYVDFGDKAEGPAIVAANVNRIGVADGILFSRQPKYNANMAKAGRITDQLVSERPGFFAKLKENMLGMGFRTRFIDSLAPLEKIAGQVTDAVKATQMMYYLRMYGQRMNFTSLAITDGVPQLVEKKREDGGSEWIIESVPGVNIKDIVGTLSAKDVIKAAGSPDAANRLFTLYMAKLRADSKGYDALNFGRAAAEAELKEIERELASGKLSADDTARVKQRRAHLEKTKDTLPTEQDIKEAFAEIQADPVLREAFATARDQYNEYNRNLLQFMVQTGAMSKEEAERLLKNKDYIPYYRVRNGAAELVIGGDTPVRIGNLKDSPHLQELVGGEEPIFNFLDSSVQNTSMLIDMAMRNIAVKNAMWEMASLGYAKIRKASKAGAPQGAVEFKKDGEDWYAIVDTDHIGIPSDLLVKGLAGIPTMFPAAVQVMGIPSRFLRRAITALPTYAFRQLMRDSTSAFMASGANVTPVLSALKQLGRASAIDRRGITGGQVFTGTSEDMARLLAEMQAGRPGWAKAFSRLEAMSMEADAASRRSQYESYIKQGLSEMEATMMTLESMNFSRRGVDPSVQLVTALIPFVNAQIQSLDVLYRSFRGQMPFNERLKIREKLISRGLLVAGMTIAYALAMQDDEDYQNATPDQKYNNWFVRIPGVEEAVRIPIPFELGYIFKALPEAIINSMYAQRGADEAKDAALGILRNLIPGGSNYMIPAAVKPLIEVGLGKSFFTGRDLETGAEKMQEPWARYRDTTSEIAKGLGAMFNISPIKIEALVSGYTGGMGLALLQAANFVLPGPESAKAEKRMSELPVIGSVFQPKDAAGIINDTFDRLKEASEAKNTYDDLIKRGEYKRADAYLSENADRMALASLAGDYKQQIGKITQAERQIRGIDMDPKEKREILDAMRQQKILVASSVRAVLGRIAPQ